MEPRLAAAELGDRMGRECIAARVRLINRVITGLYDEAIRPFGLRTSQSNILAVVAQIGEARPTEVCRILRIEKSTLSRDVEVMKRNGWVESDPPTGGRNQTIKLTDRGEALLAAFLPMWEKAQGEAKQLIGEEGEAALDRIASQLGFGRSSG